MTHHKTQTFPYRSFLVTCLLVGVWISISQTFRYSFVVVPLMRADHPFATDILPLDLVTNLFWGIWIIVYVLWSLSYIWAILAHFGDNIVNALVAGLLAAIPVYGLFWLALYLMNIARMDVIAIALPLACFELCVASLLVLWRRKRSKERK